jgi:hypothetical protein
LARSKHKRGASHQYRHGQPRRIAEPHRQDDGGQRGLEKMTKTGFSLILILPGGSDVRKGHLWRQKRHRKGLIFHHGSGRGLAEVSARMAALRCSLTAIRRPRPPLSGSNRLRIGSRMACSTSLSRPRPPWKALNSRHIRLNRAWQRCHPWVRIPPLPSH